MIQEYHVLFRSVYELRFRLWVRYWFDSISAIITFYLMFILVFFGGRSVAPAAFGDTTPSLIVGFFVWTMAFGTFQDPARGLMDNAQWGTLERLYMTPLGFESIIAIRTSFYFLRELLFGLVLLGLMMVTSGRILSVDLVTIVPLALLTISTAAGLGFVFGGIAIVYKRISNIFVIVQFLLGGILLAPSNFLVDLLPLKQGFELILRAMEDGVRLWQFSTADLVIVVFTAFAYLAVGMLVLRYCIRVARNRGVMDHY